MRHSRRAFLRRAGAAAAGIALSSCASSQGTTKLPRLGYFATTDPPDPALVPIIDAFLDGLKSRGYEDGKTLAIEWRYSGGDDARLDSMAAEFVRIPVDVMVASNAQAIRAAKRASVTVPIVMLLGSDPVESGLVASLARPGGNVTGMASLTSVTATKRLELLKEAFPAVSRVAILGSIREGDPSGPLQLRAAEQAAQSLGVEPVMLEIREAAEVPRSLDTATARGADALLVMSVPAQILRLRKEIVAYATARRIPSAYPNVGAFVDEGGLIGYSESVTESFRRAAGFVDRILKGARPADLPVEQPTTFDLVINVKAAAGLGLTIPQSVLGRATRVIQ